MHVPKGMLVVFLAAFAIGSSCACLKVSVRQNTDTAALLSISQQTMQVTLNDDFLAQDEMGSVLLDYVTARKQGIDKSFVPIASLCDQRIASNKRRISIEQELRTRPNMYGRLLIPGVGIDVAIIMPTSASSQDEYYRQCQIITDTKDSACLLTDRLVYGTGNHVIADHSNQDFRTLPNVTVGMRAQIIRKDQTINLICSTAFNGHNYGVITDLQGNDCETIADYICYTCQDNWQNVRVVGFNVVSVE